MWIKGNELRLTLYSRSTPSYSMLWIHILISYKNFNKKQKYIFVWVSRTDFKYMVFFFLRNFKTIMNSCIRTYLTYSKANIFKMYKLLSFDKMYRSVNAFLQWGTDLLIWYTRHTPSKLCQLFNSKCFNLKNSFKFKRT